MIAAIYARKSTEQNVVDEQKSVARQIAHAREFAASQSWPVAEEHIYSDDGISGAEFAKRPAFSRMMATLTRRGAPFNILIVSEISRLGREQLETGHALKQLSRAGIRIFSYLDRRELQLETAIDRFTLQALNLAAELEREKNSQRSHDKALSLARAGHVAGGRCFGYDLVDLMRDGQRVRRAPGQKKHPDAAHVEYAINEGEAAVVRRIFELIADGIPQLHVVKRLNADGAAPPRPQQGRPAAWSPSSVHEALHRDRYRGDIVWNRTRKKDQWGQRAGSERDESNWIRVHREELRIVSDELWKAAHEQITRAAAVSVFPKRWQHRETRYLLTGLARCAVCGGGMCVRTRDGRGDGRRRSYACTSHWYRGASVCGNGVQVPVALIDEAALGIGELVSPDLASEYIAAVRARVERRLGSDPRAAHEGQLEELSRQIERYVDAIGAAGDISPAEAGARLRGLEERRQSLQEAIAALPATSPLPRIDWHALERQARRQMDDWRDLLSRHASVARPVLRELLEAPIRFTPIVNGPRRGYQFEGAVRFGELLAGNVVSDVVASPGTGTRTSGCDRALHWRRDRRVVPGSTELIAAAKAA